MIVVSPQMQAWVDQTRAEEARATRRERQRMAYIARAAPTADALIDRLLPVRT